MGSLFSGGQAKTQIYEPDSSADSRKELLKRGTVLSSDMPLQGVADLTPLEQYIQQITQNYVKSSQPNTYQNAIDLASKTANESTDIMSLPEVQGLMSQIQEAGSKESNRLGRTLQLTGGAGTSKGRNVLGQNVTNMQNQMASSMSNFLNAERARKLQATGLMSDLQNAQSSDLLQKIQTGSAVGSLPRQMQQQQLNSLYGQQMMPWTQQASILQSLLSNPQVLGQSGASQSGFSQMLPLIGPMMNMFGPMLAGAGGGAGAASGAGGLFGGGAAAGAGAGTAGAMSLEGPSMFAGMF
ncbi:MAG: hypothetical protein WC356_03585 [Candidatus Micrarchaeia archaeon]|jgi:hypothetical protein